MMLYISKVMCRVDKLNWNSPWNELHLEGVSTYKYLKQNSNSIYYPDSAEIEILNTNLIYDK